MIKIYGASDDLIEIEGAIEEEFNSYECKDGLLAISDGTLLRVDYDEDGIWRFTPLYKGSSFVSHTTGSIKDDTSDEIILDGVINWITFADGEDIQSVKVG